MSVLTTLPHLRQGSEEIYSRSFPKRSPFQCTICNYITYRAVPARPIPSHLRGDKQQETRQDQNMNSQRSRRTQFHLSSVSPVYKRDQHFKYNLFLPIRVSRQMRTTTASCPIDCFGHQTWWQTHHNDISVRPTLNYIQIIRRIALFRALSNPQQSYASYHLDPVDRVDSAGKEVNLIGLCRGYSVSPHKWPYALIKSTLVTVQKLQYWLWEIGE